MVAIQDKHVCAIRDLTYQIRDIEIKYDILRQEALEHYKDSDNIPKLYEYLIDILDSCVSDIKEEIECFELETVQEEEDRRAEEGEYINEDWLREKEQAYQVYVQNRVAAGAR